MKILHLVRSMNVGGLEKVVVDLTNGTTAEGVENYLGCLFEKGIWANHCSVHSIWEGHRDRFSRWKILFSLCRYIKKHNIDIIHSHNSHPHKYAVAASLLTGRPVIHTKHGRNWPDNPRWVWFSRQLSRFTKFIIPVSAEIEDIVLNIEEVPGRKVRTILNGVETLTAETHESTRINTNSDKVFIIGTVGRLSPEKQYPWLIEIFAELTKTIPDAQLVIVGEGPDRVNIEKAVAEYGLSEKVTLAGEQSNVREWLRDFDLFTLVSDQEGTSITLLEAGAEGLASVVTDVGGNSEIVQNDVNGLVREFGDKKAIVNAFVYLYEHPELRAQMGAAAQIRIAEKYSLKLMCDQYIKLYKEVS